MNFSKPRTRGNVSVTPSAPISRQRSQGKMFYEVPMTPPPKKHLRGKQAGDRKSSREQLNHLKGSNETFSTAKQINPRRGESSKANRRVLMTASQSVLQANPSTTTMKRGGSSRTMSMQDIYGNIQKIKRTALNSEKRRRKFINPSKQAGYYYDKIVDHLCNVDEILMKEDEEEKDIGPDEYKKRQFKAAEFAVRFYRNYTYQLKRRITNLKQTITTPYDQVNQGEKLRILGKVICAYQIASQSLQVYVTYVTSPQGMKLPEKLCEFIRALLALHTLCKDVLEPYLNQESINRLNFDQKCKSIISKANFNMYQNKDDKKLKTFENDGEKDYSMYKSKFTIPNVPPGKSAEKMARMRFGAIIMNRKKREEKKKELKAATRCLAKAYSQNFETFQSNREQSRQKKESRKEPKDFGVRRSYDDDELETMVQSVSSGDQFKTNDDFVHSFLDIEPEIKKSESAIELRELILKAIHKLDTVEHDVIKRSTTDNHVFQPLETARNVRLYCLKSRDLVDIPEVLVDSPTVGTPRENINLKKIPRSLRMVFRPLNNISKNKCEIGEGPIVLKVKKEVTRNARKYRKRFRSFTQENKMYGTSLIEKPWEFIGRISETILAQAMMDITTEIDNSMLLSRLYTNEMIDF